MLALYNIHIFLSLCSAQIVQTVLAKSRTWGVIQDFRNFKACLTAFVNIHISLALCHAWIAWTVLTESQAMGS